MWRAIQKQEAQNMCFAYIIIQVPNPSPPAPIPPSLE